MRSGTLPTPLCVGLGEACAIAQREMGAEAERLKALRDRMYKKIKEQLPEVYLNGDLDSRIPGNLNLSFSCVEGESLMMGIKDLAVSSGSACTSASLEPSYVLRALGVEEEIDCGVKTSGEELSRLRAMSPLWEMVQEGIDLKSIKWTDH